PTQEHTAQFEAQIVVQLPRRVFVNHVTKTRHLARRTFRVPWRFGGPSKVSARLILRQVTHVQLRATPTSAIRLTSFADWLPTGFSPGASPSIFASTSNFASAFFCWLYCSRSPACF